MDLELVSQVWQELKHHVSDKTDAADALVTVLMENGGNIGEIKTALTEMLLKLFKHMTIVNFRKKRKMTMKMTGQRKMIINRVIV